MSDRLPPDLSSLGDELCAAAERRARRRRRRAELATRLAMAGIAGALVFSVLTPGPLGPADGGGSLLQLASAPAVASGPSAACDQPRRATFSASSPCAGSSLVLLRRAYAH
jgi:hypothetical protein